MNELNKTLKTQAISLGLCAQWSRMWSSDWSPQKMIDKMYEGIDFCLKYHWPSNNFIAEHFDNNLLMKNNIYVNNKRSVNNPQQSLSLGVSEVTYRYNGNNHGIIHIRDNSSVNVIAKNRSFVIVHLFEEVYMVAKQIDMAKVIIVKHSPDVTIIADENIEVKEEYDYLKK